MPPKNPQFWSFSLRVLVANKRFWFYPDYNLSRSYPIFDREQPKPDVAPRFSHNADLKLGSKGVALAGVVRGGQPLTAARVGQPISNKLKSKTTQRKNNREQPKPDVARRFSHNADLKLGSKGAALAGVPPGGQPFGAARAGQPNYQPPTILNDQNKPPPAQGNQLPTS